MNPNQEEIIYYIKDIFTECIQNGYSLSGSIGKIKYELEPMFSSNEGLCTMYFELAYFCATKHLRVECSNCYKTFNDLSSKNSPSYDFSKLSSFTLKKKFIDSVIS